MTASTSKPTSTTQLYNRRENVIPSLPGLSITTSVSLQQTERDIFYSTYWEDRCLPALNPLFQFASHLTGNFPALKDAVLALASCNLSRVNAERRSPAAISYMGTYAPNSTHQTRSQVYYSSAIHKFTKLSQSEYRCNFAMVLTILVLFTHIESSRGNFGGFNCHVQGLTSFLDNETGNPTGDLSFLRRIVTAWMQPQFQVWWARSYFSALDVQLQQPRIVIPRVLQGNFESLHERRISVLSIMCESHRLNFTAILDYWRCSTSVNETEERYGACEHGFEHYCKLLAEESKKLDDWLAQLPLCEQPIQNNYYCASTDLIELLMFESHDAALNYAYYALARIMQCTAVFHILQSGDFQYLGYECYEAEPWGRLLLRIAKGIDMEACIRQNTWTIGFSGLFLAALLRCQDTASGIWIEHWLQNLSDMQPTEEGSFPVYQALAVARAINQQRMIGRDVFSVSQSLDDGGGTPKFSSYNSQIIDALLIHGRCRATGDLFTDCISI
jgi:hypothetical protein